MNLGNALTDAMTSYAGPENSNGISNMEDLGSILQSALADLHDAFSKGSNYHNTYRAPNPQTVVLPADEPPAPTPGNFLSNFIGTITGSKPAAAASALPQSALYQKAIPILQKNGIPLSVGLGQLAAEGRSSGLGASRNNFYNIGGYDGQEANMPSYQTPEQGIQAYADLIKSKYPQAYAVRNNPSLMMQKISQGGYAGDPSTYTQRASARSANGQPYANYANFVMDTPEFKQYSNLAQATPQPGANGQ